MTFFNNPGFAEEKKIVTVDGPCSEVLEMATDDIQEDELSLAREIAEQLLMTLKPFSPAAGLAAPQIGISKSIFIYSYDRKFENLEVVINPSYEPLSEAKIEGWEGCFSTQSGNGHSKLAKVPRFEKIRVQYLDLEGVWQEKILDGFAAKVFQHEYDHLQGMVNISREDASIKEFQSDEEMIEFLNQVKKKDSQNYNKPEDLS